MNVRLEYTFVSPGLGHHSQAVILSADLDCNAVEIRSSKIPFVLLGSKRQNKTIRSDRSNHEPPAGLIRTNTHAQQKGGRRHDPLVFIPNRMRPANDCHNSIHAFVMHTVSLIESKGM